MDQQPAASIQLDADGLAQREALADALEEAGRRAAAAELARAAAIAEIGELLRRDKDTGTLVGIVAAESLTGLTRPTLTKARADLAGWSELCKLARAVLAVGDDHGDEAALHARLPHLGGWHAATERLHRQHDTAYWDARGGFDPMADLDAAGTPAGYDDLMAVYNAELRRYAA
jgi:hypothetical protein